MDDLLHHTFALGFPGGWEDRSDVLLAGPSRDGISPTVAVKRILLKVELTLARFVEFQRHGLEMVLKVTGLDVIEEGETTLAGLEAYMRVYRIKYLDAWLIQRQVYALRGEIAYVITETSTPDHYEEDLPLFDEVIKSFQFVLPAE